MSKPKLFSLNWSDARFLDLWSIVHFLSGVICAPVALFFSISFWPGLITVAVAAILYEYGEAVFGVSEDWGNIIIDIVLAMAGYAVYLRVFSGRPNDFHWMVLVITTVVNSFLTYLGYLNYRRRSGGKNS